MCGLASMKSWKGCVFFKKLIVRKIFIAYERDWLVSLVQHFKTDEPVICYQCFYGVVHYQLTYQRPVWFQRWTYSCWPVLISMSCIVCLHWNGRVWLNSYLQSGCAFKKNFFSIPVRINVHKQFDVTHVPPFKVEQSGATVWRGWCGPMCE